MIELTQQDWAEKISNEDSAVILDVRTADEVSQGYIPGAIHLDIYEGPQFIEGLERLDKEKHYFVYCRVGGRSGQACLIMDQMGFKNTYNLLGGIKQWRGDLIT